MQLFLLTTARTALLLYPALTLVDFIVWYVRNVCLCHRHDEDSAQSTWCKGTINLLIDNHNIQWQCTGTLPCTVSQIVPPFVQVHTDVLSVIPCVLRTSGTVAVTTWNGLIQVSWWHNGSMSGQHLRSCDFDSQLGWNCWLTTLDKVYASVTRQYNLVPV